MSNDDRVQLAPDCFIQDSAGIFSDKKKEEKPQAKPQPKLPAVPEPMSANYVTNKVEEAVAYNPARKKVTLVELCKQIATTAEYVGELGTAVSLIQAGKAGCVMMVLQTENVEKPLVISEIPVNQEAALAGLHTETDRANQTIKTLLAKVEAKDHA